MKITKEHFNSILLDLIDENPIGNRGILRVCKLVFTDEVPTLGITLGGEPQLCVNLKFVSRHCHTEEHVKAVIIHEFLHVLLNHTERFTEITPAVNIALDGVINAIIHRSFGEEYSSMMSIFYRGAEGAVRLLRPMNQAEKEIRRENRDWDGFNCDYSDNFIEVWGKLYEGHLVVDDLLEIVGSIGLGSGGGPLKCTFLGDHTARRTEVEELSIEIEAALRNTLSSIDGKKIWRDPRSRGVGSIYERLAVSASANRMSVWEREAAKVLAECVTPDTRSRIGHEERTMPLPLLNESDKRGFLRSLWSPFLPDIVWKAQKQVRIGTTQIYLDVSGSMNREMDALVSLIWRLRRHVRLPFWAFSDEVAPAVIKDGRLVTSTTGGTAMNSVLEHVAETRPGKAVVITDGYIEECDRKLLRAVKGQDIRAIVSRNGSPAKLVRSGIPYLQLGRFAYDQNC